MRRERVKDKAVKTSISLPDEMLVAAREVADRNFGGNLSAYLQHLVAEDIKGKVPDARTPDIFEILTKLFRPALALRMHERLGGADQLLMLDNLIEQVLLAAEANPKADLALLQVTVPGPRRSVKTSELERLFRSAAQNAGLVPAEKPEMNAGETLPEKSVAGRP